MTRGAKRGRGGRGGSGFRGWARKKPRYNAPAKKFNNRRRGYGKGRGTAGVVTTQSDYKTQYYRAPRRYRPSPFKRALIRNNLSELATQLFMRNGNTQIQTSNQQAWFTCALYTLNGTVGGGTAPNINDFTNNNDMATLRTTYGFTDNQQIYFVGAHMDVTYINASEFPICIDVYEYRTRFKRPYANMEAAISDAQGDVLRPGGTGTNVTINTRGVSPFELSNLCSHINIVKKTKYVLQPLDCSTYLVKSTKKFSMDINDISVTSGSQFQSAHTHGVLMTAYPVGTVIVSPAQIRVNCQCTRYYRFKEMEKTIKTAVEA